LGSIDFETLEWVDAEYRADHGSRLLPIDPASGSHNGVVVATAGQVAWIDAGIAELIYRLWRLGVRTNSCCENWFEVAPPEIATVFIELIDVCDLEQLLRTVAVRAPASGLVDRMEDIERWRIGLSPMFYERALLRTSVTIGFPIADVADVVAALRE
jgi:hypothetical protein